MLRHKIFSAHRRVSALGVIALVSLGLSACETSEKVVDAINPVSWFEEDPNPATDRPVPNEEASFPNLGAVPERPSVPEIRRDYQQLADVLAADRENALYTDEVIRREAPPLRNARPPVLEEAPSPPPTATIASASPQPVEAAPSQAQPAPEPQSVQPAPAPAPEPVPAPEPEPLAPPAPAPSPEPLNAPQAEATAPETPQEPPPSAAPLANESPALVAPVREQIIATIYFPTGGTRLTERDRGILGQVASIFRERGAKKVAVIGHSSTSGAQGSASQQALVNYKVSLDRAAAIGQELVRFGVPLEDILVDARGAQELKYAEDTPAGEAGNRRAEIFLQY